LKRFAKADEIAKMIYVLCAENTYITNEIVTVAGGE
jgi:NAD(P)-dependent dehydrogenase (short-subunit alcohol dehydrogenase family)